MNHIQAPNLIGKQHLPSDETSWVNIVDLIFDIVRRQERLAIKHQALGERKRRAALRDQNQGARR